jgi:hypothetical protein
MTFDPFRDMRDAVPNEPPLVDREQGPGSWLGVAFALGNAHLGCMVFLGRQYALQHAS